MIRLWMAKLICPPTHRLIEVGDHVKHARTAADDLIRGGDALARGWGCHPAILYNAAAILRRFENRPTRTVSDGRTVVSTADPKTF